MAELVALDLELEAQPVDHQHLKLLPVVDQDQLCATNLELQPQEVHHQALDLQLEGIEPQHLQPQELQHQALDLQLEGMEVRICLLQYQASSTR